MRTVFCLLISAIFILQSSVQRSTPSSPTYSYVAAVVEYSPITGSTGDTAADTVSKNVARYVQLIQQAAQQGADIIVFPECGLVTLSSSTEFATRLPNPDDLVNPCTDTSSHVEEAIRTLSCEARRRSIYVVVNLPEVEPCLDSTNCSSSGALYYNSDVAFDRNGTVVARYRKFHLFGEPGFSTTQEPEFSTFDTDFGVKFGMFTCFDILFEEPAVSLVKVLGVTDVVFPTAWFSELPFHSGVQVQASWASGLDVNLLAAGYNNPQGGSTGSGIYAGKDGPLVTIMSTVPASQLLMATVPKKISQHAKPVSNISQNFCDLNTAPSHRNVFSDKLGDNNSRILMLRDYLEPYETLLLTEEEFFSEHTLCHSELCCDFQVAMHANQRNLNSSGRAYVYRLAVFDGIRSYSFVTGGVQICAVMFCTDNNLSSCGFELETSEQETFRMVFDYIHISGNFHLNSSIQLPNALVRGYGVLSPDRFQFTREEIPEKNEVKVDMRMTNQNSNLLTFAIFGRNFQKDGGPVTNSSVGYRINGVSVFILLSVSAFLFVESDF